MAGENWLEWVLLLKARMCWRILRGHPVGYRLRIEGAGVVMTSKCMLVECQFTSVPGDAVRVEGLGFGLRGRGGAGDG